MTSYGALAFSSLLRGVRIALNGSVPLVKASRIDVRHVSSQTQHFQLLKTSPAARVRPASPRFGQGAGKAAHEEPLNWGVRPSAVLSLCVSICGLGFLCGGSEPGGAAAALSAAGLLNLALLVHEAGHLAAARAMGVAVREFAVGVGPRVAWWQAGPTTYTLRALPMFGYVSFLTADHLTAAHGGGALAGSGTTAGFSGCRTGRPLMLLEWLSPGRRAVVMAAGVAANVLLAAAFVTYQVCTVGEVGVVTRPGARVARVAPEAAAWGAPSPRGPPSGEEQLPGQRQEPGGRPVVLGADNALLLRRGDVILSVAGRALPAGGNLDAAIADALRAAAAEAAADAEPGGAAAAVAAQRMATSDGALWGDAAAAAVVAEPPEGVAMPSSCVTQAAGGDGGGRGGSGAVELGGLRGAKMEVLRPAAAATGDAAADARTGNTGLTGSRCEGNGTRRAEVLELDASQLLCFETLALVPNQAVGCRRPGDAWEAARMARDELLSWACIVLESWTEAMRAATGLLDDSHHHHQQQQQQQQQHRNDPLPRTAAATPAGSSNPASIPANSSNADLLTTAAAAGHPTSGAPSTGDATTSSSTDSTSGTDSSSVRLVGPLGLLASAAALAQSSDCSTSDDLGDFRDDSLRTAPLLLQLGIQVNLQLFFVNLLPIPVLDGGQLLLVALEAARGGRKLPPALERTALLVSGVAVGGWLLAISMRDAVGLMDRAAGRWLEAALEPPVGANRQLLRRSPVAVPTDGEYDSMPAAEVWAV